MEMMHGYYGKQARSGDMWCSKTATIRRSPVGLVSHDSTACCQIVPLTSRSTRVCLSGALPCCLRSKPDKRSPLPLLQGCQHFPGRPVDTPNGSEQGGCREQRKRRWPECPGAGGLQGNIGVTAASGCLYNIPSSGRRQRQNFQCEDPSTCYIHVRQLD